MDMSGISKIRIKTRIEALRNELTRLQVSIAQYAAAIAELEELLKPEQMSQPTEYIEATDQSIVEK